MSTYAEDPHVFCRLDSPPSNSCADISAFVTKLRNCFVEGGWDVETIGPRIIVRTEASSGFPLCILGTDEISFYRVSLSSGGFWGIVDEGAIGDCVTDCTIQQYITVSAQTARDEVHTAIKAAIVNLYDEVGVTAYALPTEMDGTDRISEIVLLSGDNCIDTIAIGNQLESSVEQSEGAGFIARSQDSITDGNNVEIYCTYLGTGGPASFVRLYYRVNGWTSRSIIPGAPIQVTTFCPDGQFEYLPATAVGDHPLSVVDDELDTTVVDNEIPLNGEDIIVWINPYSFIHDQAGIGSGTSAHTLCCALKIKALEGELLETDPGYPDDLNFDIARFFIALQGGGTSLRDEMAMQHSDSILEFVGTEFSVQERVTTTHGNWGPLILCGVAETVNYENHANGLVWNGGIAEIAEPWVACNFMNPGADFAPIIGQLWDAIIPYRSINLGFDNHVTEGIFPWDGQLWRYYQTDREGRGHSGNPGPPSSMAFRVGDGRIFDGTNYSGASLATVVSVEASPNPVPSSNNIDFTITINAAPSNGAMVVLQSVDDERIAITSPIVVFTSGQTSKVVTVTTNGLGITETVRVTAKGVNIVFTDVVLN